MIITAKVTIVAAMLTIITAMLTQPTPRTPIRRETGVGRARMRR